MPSMNRYWRPCQWLALSLMTAAMAGCAPTAEREDIDLALASTMTTSSASTESTASAVPSRRVSKDQALPGYDFSRPSAKPPVTEEPNAATAVDSYITSRYKDKGLGVKSSKAQVEPEVDADDPDKYELKGPVRDSDQQGKASWYGEQFHGKRTASGERFDLNEMTAAHRNLPFGTRVCVRSAVTGKSVVVRINDRGPFAPGRVIDLSKAAAQELGMLGLGIKPVEIWHLGKKEAECPDLISASAARKRHPSSTNTAKAKTDKARATTRSVSVSSRKAAPSKHHK